MGNEVAEFERLQAKVFGWTASSEESARFWELARTSKVLPKPPRFQDSS